MLDGQAFKGSPCATDGTLAAIVDMEGGNKCSKILCADYARLGFYYAQPYAQPYAQAAFIMRDMMRGARNTAIHYARIMRACVLLCAALCATLCADS